MIRGLYTSASGMLADAVRMDVIANNLANAVTTGYKRDTAVTQSFEGMLLQRLEPGPGGTGPLGAGNSSGGDLGSMGLGVYVDATAARLTSGTLRPTGNALDVALLGDGFFTIRTPQGIRYTRQGSFVQDSGGRLETSEGFPVLVNGEPVGESGDALRLDDAGNVWVNEQFWGTLDIVTSRQAGPLRKVGEGRWGPATDGVSGVLPAPGALAAAGMPASAAGTPEEGAPPYVLRVGFLEASNVDPTREMVTLITVLRSYEANQRAVQAQDETLGRLVNDLLRG